MAWTWSIELAQWKSYKHKHGPRPTENFSWREQIKSTRHQPALYLPDTNVQLLEMEIIRTGRVAYFDRHMKFMYRVFDTVIGACCGSKTNIVIVQWDADTMGRAVHGQPFAPDEMLEALEGNDAETELFKQDLKEKT